MRKFYLGLLMLLTAVSSFAFNQDYIKLTAYASYEDEEFSDEINLVDLNAGEEAYVVCTIVNSSDSVYDAFEILYSLPEGYDLEQIYDEDEEEYYYTRPLNEIGRTNRWTYKDNYFEDSKTIKAVVFTLNPDKYQFPAVSGKYAGNDLMYFKVKATANARKDFAPLTVTKIIFSRSVNTGEVDEDGKDIVRTEGHYLPNVYNLYYSIGQSGYSTLCYPTDLDFTSTAVKANVAKNNKNGYVTLVPVDVIPSGTPVVVTGAAGSYMLSAKYLAEGEEIDDSNLAINELMGTADAAYTVEGNNVFALASKSEGIGFYRCSAGVVIPRYKAYMESASSVDSMIFEETTGIQQMKAEDASADVYTISGVKVNNAQRKGIYITNGKKVIVK